MTGMSLTDAEATLAKYFSNYRELDNYLRASALQAVENRYAKTLSGRMVRYRFDPENKEAVGEVKRAGRNAPIQGTSADILKRALRLVRSELKGTTAEIVNVIHDEIVIECDDNQAEDVAHKVSTAMVAAGTEYITAVPILAEPTIADCWIKD